MYLTQLLRILKAADYNKAIFIRLKERSMYNKQRMASHSGLTKSCSGITAVYMHRIQTGHLHMNRQELSVGRVKRTQRIIFTLRVKNQSQRLSTIIGTIWGTAYRILDITSNYPLS